MKKVKLLHNPGAGGGDHGEERLISLIESNGFECSYSSVKEKDWRNNIEPETDFFVAAGGDGTIRRITKELLEQKAIDKIHPIAILPLGTANNIAKTLGIEGKTEDIIQSWHKCKIQKYDVGKLSYKDETHFFLESFGYGVFQYMMRKIKGASKKEIEDPEKRLEAMLKSLREFVIEYEPRLCRLEADSIDHSGKYLLVEIMNAKSIGPNLILAPDAETDDGELNIVLIAEKDKENFATYLLNKANGTQEAYPFSYIKAKKIKISWDGTHMHTDDTIVKVDDNAAITIELKEGLLEFLVP